MLHPWVQNQISLSPERICGGLWQLVSSKHTFGNICRNLSRPEKHTWPSRGTGRDRNKCIAEDKYYRLAKCLSLQLPIGFLLVKAVPSIVRDLRRLSYHLSGILKYCTLLFPIGPYLYDLLSGRRTCSKIRGWISSEWFCEQPYEPSLNLDCNVEEGEFNSLSCNLPKVIFSNIFFIGETHGLPIAYRTQ